MGITMTAEISQNIGLAVEEALRLALRDVANIIPKLAASILAGAITALIAILLMRLVSRLLKASKVDELLDPIFARYGVPFTLSSLIKGLLAFVLVLIIFYVSVVAGFPEYGNAVSQAIIIAGRVASVIVMILITYVTVNYVTEKLRMERGLRGFMALVIFDISLILVIDMTALSPPVKEALAWGLSLGLGLSIAVFTAWYFFGQEIRARRERGRE
jgi:hypothetical protein